MCIMCIQIQDDLISFEEALKNLNEMPDNIYHKQEIENLIKVKFKNAGLISLESIKEIQKRYVNGRYK